MMTPPVGNYGESSGNITFDFNRFQMDITGDVKEGDSQEVVKTGIETLSPIPSNSNNQTASSTFPWSAITPAIPYTSEKLTDGKFAMRLSKRTEPVDGNCTPLFKKAIQTTSFQSEEEELEEIYRNLTTFEQMPFETLLGYTDDSRAEVQVWLERFELLTAKMDGSEARKYQDFLKQLNMRLSNPRLKDYFELPVEEFVLEQEDSALHE